MRVGIPEMRNGLRNCALDPNQNGRRQAAPPSALRAVLPPKVPRRRPRVQQDCVQEEAGEGDQVSEQRGPPWGLGALSFLGEEPRLPARANGRE